MPPFRGWAENHSAAGNFHSSQAGLEEVFNPTGRLVNKKRPPETLPNHHRLDLPGFDTHWANYAVPDGFLGEKMVLVPTMIIDFTIFIN
jgi:hypothetical protein